jgi:hypothetical protein
MVPDKEAITAQDMMLCLSQLHGRALRDDDRRTSDMLGDLIRALRHGESHPLLDEWVRRTG